MREPKKIDNQESRDELGIWVEFLSQRKDLQSRGNKSCEQFTYVRRFYWILFLK